MFKVNKIFNKNKIIPKIEIGNGLVLSILSSINIMVTFLIQMVTINAVGPGYDTDALYIGMAIPVFILSVTVGSVSNVLIPIFSGVNKEDLGKIVSSVSKIAFYVGIMLCTSLIVSANYWLDLLVDSESDYLYILTKELCVIQLITIPFAFVHCVLWSALNAIGKHIESEKIPAIFSLFSLPVLTILVLKFGVIIVALWQPVKFLFSCIVLYIKNKNEGVHLRLSGKSIIPEIKNIWKRLKYILFGSVYYKSEPVIDRALLSSSSAGDLSLFVLVQAIYGAVSQIMSRAIVLPVITKLSKAFSRNQIKDVRMYYYQTMKIILLLNVTVIFIIFNLGDFISNILLYFSNDNKNLIPTLDSYLKILLGFLVGNVIGSLTSGAMYSIGKTKKVSYLAMLLFTIYLPFKVYFYNHYGNYGLAYVISIYSIVSTLIIGITFHFEIKRKEHA